jgi:uncharacterized protein YdcH (DUF465 family)
MAHKKQKDVVVNTLDESTIYCQGHYPVGHIRLVMNDYIMRAEWFDKLVDNMTDTIKRLEKEIELSDDKITNNLKKVRMLELKKQLISVDAWWEASMEDTSKLHSVETCQHLRPFK